MNQYVSDTMAIVSYLAKRRLPPAVKQLFQSADVGLTTIYVPAIVAVEINYLSEKGRIDASLADLQQYLNQFKSYHFQPLTLDIIEASRLIVDVPELHDRLIAATARALGVPLITNDPLIQASTYLTTVW
jgi:PIN domain nuclease of toxin-antitoxin system